MNGLPNTIVKLMVRNHSGAMSHITGSFHDADSISREYSARPWKAGRIA